jgi:hypothetical protein
MKMLLGGRNVRYFPSSSLHLRFHQSYHTDSELPEVISFRFMESRAWKYAGSNYTQKILNSTIRAI